jgi:hypothetical protein
MQTERSGRYEKNSKGVSIPVDALDKLNLSLLLAVFHLHHANFCGDVTLIMTLGV